MATVNKRYFIENKELATKEYAESAFTAARTYTDNAIANIDMQYETMPVASENTLGKVIQYIGETTSLYTQGYFYLGIAEEVSGVVSYSWKEIGTQEVDLSNYLAKDNTTSYTPTNDYNPATKKYVDDNKQFIELSLLNTEFTDGNNLEVDSDDITVIEETLGDLPNGNYMIALKTVNPNILYGNAEIFGDATTKAINIMVDCSDYRISISYYSSPGFTRCEYSQGGYVTKSDIEPLIIQCYDLPEASEEFLDRVFQYIGPTTQDYTQGYFYICVSDGGDPAIYSWENLNVQEGGSDLPIYIINIAGIMPSIDNKNNVKSDLTNIVNDAYEKGYRSFALIANYYRNNYPWVNTIMFCNYGTGEQTNNLQSKPTSYGLYSPIVNGTSSNTFSGPILNHFRFQFSISWNGNVATVTDVNVYTETQTFIKANDVLIKSNTTSFTPTGDYNPATKKYVDDTVASAMSAAIKREIVQELPVSDIKTDTIYMVPKSEPGSQNVYDEYMYINNAWEKIGDTEIDLSDYATKEYVEENTTQQKDTMPEASASNVGEIIQYSGETNEYYTQGYFYICKEEEVSGVVTYYWEQVNAQPDAGKYKFFKGTQTEWDQLGSAEQQTILFAAVLPDEELVLTPEEEEDLTSSLGVDSDIEVDMSLEDALDTALDIANGN